MNTNNKDHVQLPRIDCVIIGVNTAATLASCINSIKQSDYPQERLTIIYVDGGSCDNSIAIAESLPYIQVISLGLKHPTPGLGRNAGWRNSSAPFVQFLDSDTILDPDWLRKGVEAFQTDIAAVMGYRLEIDRAGSVFNWIASLEWNSLPGDAESFGGDVMVKRHILQETNGYDEILVGGEDPELSRRIRLKGWRIRQLGANMTYHDLAMTRISQYFKRAYRSGYGFAAVIDRFSNSSCSFWKKDFRRILVRGGGFLGLSIAALAGTLFFSSSSYGIVTNLIIFLTGLLLLLFPRLFRVRYFQEDKNISYEQAKVYAWHCSLVVIPDLLGVMRYYWGKFCNRPLLNHTKKTTITHIGRSLVV